MTLAWLLRSAVAALDAALFVAVVVALYVAVVESFYPSIVIVAKL